MDSNPKKETKKNKSNDFLYKVERVCGNGSFGIVFQAKVIHTGEIVAIKKVYQDRRYKNREYTLTKEGSHPNIIKLIHAFYTKGEKSDEIYLNLVLNYVSDNLNRVIRNYVTTKENFPIFLIKLYTFQVARALNYIHCLKVIHRDIKPQNIGIDPSTNRVYLSDFGSAKKIDYDSDKKKVNNVTYICSRYYRSPELILELTHYTDSVDIWSFGCVIAEMGKRKPFGQGEDAQRQLTKIVEIFGGPKLSDLSGIPNKEQAVEQFKSYKPKPMDQVFPNVPKDGLNLLSKIFVYNPKKRITAIEIMAHPFYDDGRNNEICQSGKYIVPNLFDFTKKEISISKNKELFAKIIPEWSEGYKSLFD